MAIAISLVCNFSYLLLLVSNQSDSGNHRANVRKDATSVQVQGRLSVSADGFGYIITEEGDSIFVDHRRVSRLHLDEGDILLVEAAKRTSFKAKNLYMQNIIKKNGEEFDYGAFFRGSEQWIILLFQFIFYFVVSFVLLLVMSGKKRDTSLRQFLVRAFFCLLIVLATYFISPVPILHTGEIIPVYLSRHLVELAVILK
jgi:hypothetical protein